MYLTGIAIFALMLWFMRRPTLASYANLGLCSGLAAFVRPTLLCYALAAMVLAWFFAKREGWKLRRSLAGPLLFVAGCGLLFLTNELRFGSGFEFGHRLNLNPFLPMMYATRFDNPVAAAPLVSRIVELMSYLFLTRGELHCCYGYALAVFAANPDRASCSYPPEQCCGIVLEGIIVIEPLIGQPVVEGRQLLAR